MIKQAIEKIVELADLGKIAAFAASSNIRTRPMETEEDDE